jgi:hypothetical protein
MQLYSAAKPDYKQQYIMCNQQIITHPQHAGNDSCQTGVHAHTLLQYCWLLLSHAAC